MTCTSASSSFRSLLAAPALLALATLSAGGCMPYVVAQSAPPPLASYRSFIVEPMHYEQLTVGNKSEPEYLAGKNPNARASWEGDKQAFSNEAMRALMERAGQL